MSGTAGREPAGSPARRSRRLRTAGAALAGAGLVWAGAEAGLWWTPLALGGAAGVLLRALVSPSGARHVRRRLAAGLVAASGWGLPLLLRDLAGEPIAATARTVAGLSGLPGQAAVVIAATLVLPASLAAVGVWAGESIAAAVTGFRAGPGEPGSG
jgi:hypothetical protein